MKIYEYMKYEYKFANKHTYLIKTIYLRIFSAFSHMKGRWLVIPVFVELNIQEIFQ